MSSGMNRTQAEEYAKTMTYKQAIGNIWTGKGIKYRKATMIKLHELAEIADRLVMCKDCKYGEKRIEDYRCWMLDEDWDIRFSPRHFCSYGKRREDSEA